MFYMFLLLKVAFIPLQFQLTFLFSRFLFST